MSPVDCGFCFSFCRGGRRRWSLARHPRCNRRPATVQQEHRALGLYLLQMRVCLFSNAHRFREPLSPSACLCLPLVTFHPVSSGSEPFSGPTRAVTLTRRPTNLNHLSFPCSPASIDHDSLLFFRSVSCVARFRGESGGPTALRPRWMGFGWPWTTCPALLRAVLMSKVTFPAMPPTFGHPSPVGGLRFGFQGLGLVVVRLRVLLKMA